MPNSCVEEIAALRNLSVAELKAKYLELHGEESKSANKDYLWKRCAWQLQALRLGGLPDGLREQLRALAPEGVSPGAYALRRNRQALQQAKPGRRSSAGRDRRLPPMGTMLSRDYHGHRCEVIVLENGFEFEGKDYPSLSAVARVITGTQWNGFKFFGVKGP